MNTLSKKEILKVLLQYCNYAIKQEVADFGSYDMNGTYKNDLPEIWHYTGYDIVPGPNVDVVMRGDYRKKDFYDAVTTVSTLEHCENPYDFIREMAYMLKPFGTIVLIAPFIKPEHGDQIYPKAHYKDLWRFLPQGMELLMKKTDIKAKDTYVIKNRNRQYTVGVGIK